MCLISIELADSLSWYSRFLQAWVFLATKDRRALLFERILGLLHIHAASRFGCRWFLSVDRAGGCRAVALALKRKALPEVDDQAREMARGLRLPR